MLLIFFYWSYLFILTSSFGILLKKIVNINPVSPFITPILGSFFITVLASIVALFYKLDVIFESLLAIISIILILIYKKESKIYIKKLKNHFSSFSKLFKILFITVFILALAQSASAPYLIDNESYYIHSIKWLDYYGLVPGLANLHFFLSQMSPWHILQSATNLNFAYSNFNDLSGFYLVLGNAYAFFFLNRYFRTRQFTDLLIGLFPISNVFLFQFIGAPSPDIGIYICFLILTSEFIKGYYSKNNLCIVSLFIISFFAIYIKITAILYVVFPVILLLKYRKDVLLITKKEVFKIILIGITTLILFIIKNTIITGFTLYPITSFDILSVDWKLPIQVSLFLTEQTRLTDFLMTADAYKNASFLDFFIQWLTLPKLDGVFNLGMCLLLFILPVVLYKSKHRKLLLILYALSVLQMVLLLNTSPQYRFFFMFFLLLLSVLIALIVSNEKLIKIGIIISVIAIAIPLLFPFNLSQFTDNKFHQNSSVFSVHYFIKPHKSTRYPNLEFTKFKAGNTHFYTPSAMKFFWGTGDGPLPTINRVQFDYFETYFKVIPQQRGQNLKDGFYSKHVPND